MLSFNRGKSSAMEPWTGLNIKLQMLAQRFLKRTLLDECSGKKHHCVSVIHRVSWGCALLSTDAGDPAVASSALANESLDG